MTYIMCSQPTSCPTHLIDKPVGDQVFGQVFREFPFLQLGGEVALEFVVKEEADVKLEEGKGRGVGRGRWRGRRKREGYVQLI